MSLTLELPPDLERRLVDGVAHAGMDLHEYIRRALEAGAGVLPAAVRRLTAGETALLQQINESLPQQAWALYEALLARRAAEQLSAEEQQTLIGLSNQIEALDVGRLEALVELASLRGVPLDELMVDLGIGPRPYA